GRVHLVQEVADNPIGAGALVERVFEDADLHELAELVFAHLTATEKTQLDARLELDGALPRARDADGVHKLFADKEYKPAKVATAIAKLLEEQKYTLGEVAAWLYARGLNFRLLQSGLNGERLDCFKLPRELRAMVA